MLQAIIYMAIGVLVLWSAYYLFRQIKRQLRGNCAACGGGTCGGCEGCKTCSGGRKK